MSHKLFLNRGMTLIETVVAVGILLITSSALMTFVVSSIGLANSSKIRSTATKLADQKMEEIKTTEQTNKLNIQAKDWSSIVALAVTDNISFGSRTNFYTRTITALDGASSCNTATTQCTVTIVVSWTDKGKSSNVTLTTLLTTWQ